MHFFFKFLLGKYRTILYLSILYMFGSIAITASSIGPLDLPARELAVIGLIIIGKKFNCECETCNQNLSHLPFQRLEAEESSRVFLHLVAINSNCPNKICKWLSSSRFSILLSTLELCFLRSSVRWCVKVSNVSEKRPATLWPLEVSKPFKF